MPAACLVLAACALGPQLQDLQLEPPALELAHTPFFPQDAHQCGPAALATVLVEQGVAVTPELLTPQVFVPGRDGSLQAEMIATARRYQRVPLPLGHHFQDLVPALKAGDPVLVFQNLGLSRFPTWHYAVLVGYDSGANTVILRSGTRRREILPVARFLDSWDKAGRWAYVLRAADSPPPYGNVREWIAAASAFESLDQAPLAERAYRAAARRWPDEPLPWLAIANVAYAQHDLAGAERALRQSLALSPTPEARNNLAQVLIERRCPQAALAELDQLGAATAELAAVAADTRRAAQAAIDNGDASCTAP